MTVQILQGDAIYVMMALPSESVQCVVTSPPYWGLRDYGLPPTVWGGADDCWHVWGDEQKPAGYRSNENRNTEGLASPAIERRDQWQGSNFCQLCGAWRGQLGLEPTPELYVEHLVDVFREVKRVLRDDGTLWLNLGSSYSNGVGSNVLDLLATSIKEGIVLDGSACSLTITAQSDGVLEHDQSPPDDVFSRLFGIKRISVKQRDHHLCQVLDGLAPIADCRISPSVVATIDEANAEVILDPIDGIRIVVSDHDLYADSPFRVSLLAGAAKDGKASLAIKESGEPMPKGVINAQAVRNPVSLYTAGKGISQVNPIHKTIPLTDALVPNAKRSRDLRVTKASAQELSLSMMDGLVEIAFGSVAHLFLLNAHGSLIRYAEVYGHTKQMSNERVAKQELGIPEMVRRALMRDGWICRSTIIWHKPNPMVESVKDRPTRAHEYVFLLTKAAQYFYNYEAAKEPCSEAGIARLESPTLPRFGGNKHQGYGTRLASGNEYAGNESLTRNRRDVWTMSPASFSGAHYAVMPTELAEVCITAGSKEGDTVLDPFGGVGTTGIAADRLGRDAVLIELSPENCRMAEERIKEDAGMWAEVSSDV